MGYGPKWFCWPTAALAGAACWFALCASFLVAADTADAAPVVSYVGAAEWPFPVVPGQVYKIVAVGARGGSTSSAVGGSGAMVTTFITVPSGITTLYAEVPSNGAPSSHDPYVSPPGGANGGGAGGGTGETIYGVSESGGGGGGAADVRTCAAANCPALTGNPATDPRLVVAGGGGGAGGSGIDGAPVGGNGGAGSQGGDNGSQGGSYGGYPGTGGAARDGLGRPTASGDHGGNSSFGGSGGGGGGWRGGGQGYGANSQFNDSGTGGGGGSSYGPAAVTRYEPAGADDASVTVSLATPLALTTQVSSSSFALGGSFHDTATLVAPPTGSPTPTGTVTFNFYKPGDTTCTGTVATTSTASLNSAGTTATSPDYKPPSTGTYRVVAAYSGDANYPRRSASAPTRTSRRRSLRRRPP